MRKLATAATAAAFVVIVGGCDSKAKVDMTMHMNSQEIVSGITGTIAALTSYYWGDPPPAAKPTPGTSSLPGFANAASMQAPRGLHTATLLGDGRVLVVGGLDAGRSGAVYVGSPEVYDPVGNGWAKVGTTGINRVFHAAVLLADGRVLVCGGWGPVEGSAQAADLASAYLFDPRANAFAPAGSLKVARHGHRAIRLSSGQVVVMGGSSPAVEIYDPATNAFTAAGSLSAARDGAGVALASGAVLAVGDAPGMEAFVLASRSVVPVAAPASVRTGATLDAISAEDALLVGGQVEIERFSSGSWATVGRLPAVRSRHGSAVSGGELLVAGGVGVEGATPLATADLVHGATNEVQSFVMTHARNSCAVTALADGRFLVSGGFEGGTSDPRGLDGMSVAAAEIFTKP